MKSDMKNIPQARDYLAKAKQGDVAAQKQLGMLLIRSNHTLDEGVAWLKKAAQTDVDAMYLLGRAYLKKQSEPQQAFYWYEKAAQNNHVDAMIDVGACYIFGFGVERDVSAAVEWYKKAAALNSPVAIHNLGFLCYQDPELYGTAFNLFTKAADLGYADSAYILGIMYLQAQGVQRDAEKALDYFVLSNKLGKHYACRPIGDLYFQGVFDAGKQNISKAINWYLTGMKNDVVSCIEALGDIYRHGFGVDVDLNLAYDFYKVAANKGSCDAAFSLGLMCFGQNAVKRDLKEALKWMIMAEKRGHKKAPQFVKMMEDVLGGSGTATGSGHAATNVGSGGSVGINLRRSYSATVEAIEAEEKMRFEQKKKRNASIYSAADAMNGGGSSFDYEMGAVISKDGEVSYVDPDLGVILGADGAVSSHDVNTGLTYNWSTGGMLAYDEMFGATIDLNSGEVSYYREGFTL